MADLSLKRKTLYSVVSSRDSIELSDFKGDVSLRDGLENVAQAIQNRLLTRKGELNKLGHDRFGSELHKLIGQPKSWKAKARAELYIREALKNEQRIEEILDIRFPDRDTPSGREELEIEIDIKVHGYNEHLRVVVAQNLTG